jgi:alkanesulfonate monooxygenase SsuD/methylene tetrahydromethanopterin reductase-like flavin-dependent oxidoreductase (luciferase family)
MKFTWFNLMPWPHLPDDFREKHRSVWVDIPSSLYDPARGHEIYNTYLDELELAEQLGFDGIGVNEHHANGYGLMPSPNIMAASLARRTERAALVVLGNSIALYNPPLRVAEEFAMLDVMSGGRLLAGFPVGTSMDTNYAYGTVPATTRSRYAEAHELIMRAWREPEPFTFNGRYTKLRYVNCWPKPIQTPPPIFIPGGGSIETWDFCLEHDYVYCYLSFYGYLRAKQLMEGFWQRVDDWGKDRSPYRAGFAQTIIVAESDREAESEYREHVDYFYNRCLHVYPGFADAPGYRTVKTIKANATSAMTRGAHAQVSSMSWAEILKNRFVIAGSPDSVVEQMSELITELRVGNIFCLLHVGDMPMDKCMRSSRLFAEEVMPRLRDLWPEPEDSRFWIKPLETRQAPRALETFA